MAEALARVSNKLPFLRVALSWRPSLFPLRDSDIGHNIYHLQQLNSLVWESIPELVGMMPAAQALGLLTGVPAMWQLLSDPDSRSSSIFSAYLTSLPLRTGTEGMRDGLGCSLLPLCLRPVLSEAGMCLQYQACCSGPGVQC